MYVYKPVTGSGSSGGASPITMMTLNASLRQNPIPSPLTAPITPEYTVSGPSPPNPNVSPKRPD